MPLIENIPRATPIDDVSNLIPTHITTRSELNEWEAANILKALQSADKGNNKPLEKFTANLI